MASKFTISPNSFVGSGDFQNDCAAEIVSGVASVVDRNVSEFVVGLVSREVLVMAWRAGSEKSVMAHGVVRNGSLASSGGGSSLRRCIL